MSAAKKDKHAEDDLRGNLVLKVGEVKDEKTFFKLRLGNNREDVTSFRAQIKEDCGKDAGLQSFWAYFGAPIAGLPTEGTYKSKDGGVWIDMNAAGCRETLQVTNILPKEDIQGELFVQVAATSDRSFKEGFYNSFHLSLSLDGSHEFAHNFGKFLVKNQYVSMHEKLLLNIIKKFKELDLSIDLETMDNLDKDVVKNLLFEGTELDNSIVDELGRMLRKFLGNLSEDSKEIAQAVSKGMRLVVLINNNMYVNAELKGEDALAFLQN